MKKSLSVILSVALIAVMLVGCGKSSKDTTLSGYLEDKHRIFLLVNSEDSAIPAKEAKVESVLIFKEDGTNMIYYPEMTLGELENMEDSEIEEMAENSFKELVKESNEKAYNELIENVTIYSEKEWEEKLKIEYENSIDIYGHRYSDISDENFYDFVPELSDWNGELGNKLRDVVKNNYIECFTTGDYKKAANNIYNGLIECFKSSEAGKMAIKAIEDYTSNPTLQYNIVINTDSTGNNAISESLVEQYAPVIDNSFAYIQDTYSLKLNKIELFGPLIEFGTTGFQIYDSYYFGYRVDIENGNTYNLYYLLTRGKNLEQFTIDPIGTKNVSVDNVDDVLEKNKKVIFDINSYIKG